MESSIEKTTKEPAGNNEGYKYWIELAKWFISSVVIVILTIIIDKGIKDREAGIQEMNAYDKYVSVVLKANNIVERWKLAEYFSIVTPTERLRDRWIAYKKEIEDDYKLYLILKKNERAIMEKLESDLKNDSTLSNKLEAIQHQISVINTPLTNAEKKLKDK
jgi:hypothetical protein